MEHKQATPQPMAEIQLDPTQLEAVRLCELGENVFLTGSAGVGKSFLLKYIIAKLTKLKKRSAVTATTGIAAVNVGGVTLWNLFGIHPAAVEDNKFKKSDAWNDIDVLVVDEVSMLIPDLFTYLNRQAQFSRKRQEPFGGVQLILVGDFYQLPPVLKNRKPSDHEFVFETQLWIDLNIRGLELKTVHRQKDKSLIPILERIRRGDHTPQDIAVLQSTSSRKRPRESSSGKEEKDETEEVCLPKIKHTKLFSLNSSVNKHNTRELNALKTQSKQYALTSRFVLNPGKKITAMKRASVLKSTYGNFPIQAVLRLKIGSQVMLSVNLAVELRLANGSRGVVVEFDQNTGFPVVQFAKIKATIRPYDWEIYLGSAGKLVITCIPLKLAWSLSIHKSQGQSITHLEVDLKKVFACGQAYVALSRSTGMDNLIVKGFTSKCVKVHPKVLKFYESFE